MRTNDRDLYGILFIIAVIIAGIGLVVSTVGALLQPLGIPGAAAGAALATYIVARKLTRNKSSNKGGRWLMALGAGTATGIGTWVGRATGEPLFGALVMLVLSFVLLVAVPVYYLKLRDWFAKQSEIRRLKKANDEYNSRKPGYTFLPK